MTRLFGYSLAGALWCCSMSVCAQRVLSLNACEALFQKNNLQLLAEQYNVSANKAALIQAKIWDQPYVSADLNLYNPERSQYFDMGNAGEKAFAIQQLIHIGGQRKREIEVAKSNIAIAELRYEALLLSLRMQLRQQFYTLYFNQIKKQVVQEQIAPLEVLIHQYGEQVKKGNLPLKDVARLTSLAMALKKDLIEIETTISSCQSTLQILTAQPEPILAQEDTKKIESKGRSVLAYSEAQIQELALSKNPDYLSACKIAENAALVARWQKALSVPDLTMGFSYDQRGAAFSNQVNFTLGMSLPLWNKNRGNILAAQAQQQQYEALSEQKKMDLFTQVSSAYQHHAMVSEQYQKNLSYNEDLLPVYQGFMDNFRKQNISVIEFVDFIESYYQSMLFVHEIQNQFFISGETLNALTNANVF